jgi:hypothetical protein
MGKPLQLDDEGNIMNDVETQKTQKAYDAYMNEKVKERNAIDAKRARGEALMRLGTDLLSRPMKEPEKKAKGGMVGSASKRADGCAVRGKTKGRMV